ncbi:MAG: Rieske 2Fe-2S domain-containing protein, partial [Bacteroidota bacterium]
MQVRASDSLLSPEAVPRPRAFAASGVTTASWFPVARSAKLNTGRVRRAEAPGGPLALWRDEAGAVHALDSRCPHLGADLSQGRVEGDALVCPFHGWAFDARGTCLHALGWNQAPARRARSVPVQERWGLIWVCNAPEAPFDLPDPPPGRWRIVRPPSQSIAAHPHLVIGNGLDVAHFDALHGLEPLAEPVVQVDPPRVSVEMVGRPRNGALRRLIGGDVRSVFTTIGGHLATVDVLAPVRFRALFSATPVPTPEAQSAGASGGVG